MKTASLRKAVIAGTVLTLAFGLNSCGSDASIGKTPSTTTSTTSQPTKSAKDSWDKNGDGIITVGLTQTGAEHVWRTANTNSYKEYFVEANGFELLLKEGCCDSRVQYDHVREFITQGVEVIVIQPEPAEGWEDVLIEAKAAGIPIINADRKLEDGMEQYYEFFFHNDLRGEGDRAVVWLEDYIADNDLKNKDIKIIHLQGSMGSDAQMGRTAGLEAGVKKNGWKIIAQQSASFVEEKAEMVMTDILKTVTASDFTVLWAESDYMVYGAIDAMKAKGLDPTHYIIISFDGNKSAVKMVKGGIIDAVVECTPLFGPQLGDLILRASNGERISSPQYAIEGIIDSTNADAKLPLAFGV